MKLVTAKLITIICDVAIESKICNEIRKSGAKGFTVTEAKGETTHSVSSSSWEGTNIRIESIVSEANANLILEQISEKYFEKYKVIAFLSDIQVLRKDKFI